MKIKPSELSITRKLFNIVFIIYITVTVVMTTYEMHAEFVQERNEIASNFDILQEFISPALADAIIQRSDQRLKFISEGVMRGPAIIGVKIEPLSDYPGIAMGDVEPGQQKVLQKKLNTHGKAFGKFMQFFSKSHAYHFTLFNKDNVTPLAEVTVYGDQSLVVAKFVRVYALIVIDEIIKTLLLWVLILWIGRKWLSIPLQRLTLATRAVAQGHMNRVHMPVSEKSTELDVLAQSFNIMVDKIQTAQAGLLNTKRHLADIIDAMPSALIAITTEGIVTDCNLRAEQMTQIDRKKAIGMHYTDLFPLLNGYDALLKQVIQYNQAEKVQNILIQEKTGRRYLDIILYPLLEEEPPGIVIRLDDITSQIKIQEKLLKQEKLQSTLKLAAGMAHEINNPLSAVLQGVQTVKRRLNTELEKNTEVAQAVGINLEHLQQYCVQREVFKFLDNIQLSGEQAAKVIATLLDFTPRAEVNYQPYNLEKITERALSHLQQDPLLRKTQALANVLIEKEYEADLPDIKCQPLEIERVLLGILKNAVQATQGLTRPGVVKIRTYTEPGWVCIVIEDNGIGMDEEVKAHLFELFFTTKGVGLGAGLDLAMAYHIIKASHQGKIKVHSVPNVGTRVSVFLPQVLVV